MKKPTADQAPLKDSPIIFVLGLIVSAFIAGFTAYYFLEGKIEKTVQSVFYEKKNKGELPPGAEGKRGGVGPIGPQGKDGVPIGTIVAYAGDVSKSPPGGWLLCDGKQLPCGSPKYGKLYNSIGITFGGNPDVFFKLPDLVGRFPIGAGTGVGLSERRLGLSYGKEHVTLTPDNLPPHVHPIDLKTEKDGAHAHVIGQGPSGDVSGGDGTFQVGASERHRNWPGMKTQEDGAHQHAIKGNTRENSTTNIPVEIMPPNVAVNYLIKYE